MCREADSFVAKRIVTQPMCLTTFGDEPDAKHRPSLAIADSSIQM
jgi:hypothetical protein